MKDLASFAASRKAVHRGLSFNQVSLSASGNLEVSDEAPSPGEQPAFDLSCPKVKAVLVKVLMKPDSYIESWTDKNGLVIDAGWDLYELNNNKQDVKPE